MNIYLVYLSLCLIPITTLYSLSPQLYVPEQETFVQHEKEFAQSLRQPISLSPEQSHSLLTKTFEFIKQEHSRRGNFSDSSETRPFFVIFMNYLYDEHFSQSSYSDYQNSESFNAFLDTWQSHFKLNIYTDPQLKDKDVRISLQQPQPSDTPCTLGL